MDTRVDTLDCLLSKSYFSWIQIKIFDSKVIILLPVKFIGPVGETGSWVGSFVYLKNEIFYWGQILWLTRQWNCALRTSNSYKNSIWDHLLREMAQLNSYKLFLSKTLKKNTTVLTLMCSSTIQEPNLLPHFETI